MRFAVRAAVLALITLFHRLPDKPPPSRLIQPAPWKSYCQADGGFCFKYPSSWKVMGEIFDGNGVVVAPPQKDEQPLWNVVTVALVAPPKDADQALGLDGVIQQASAGMRDCGQNFQTLQRERARWMASPAQTAESAVSREELGTRLGGGAGLHRRAGQRDLFCLAEIAAAGCSSPGADFCRGCQNMDAAGT